MPWTSFELHWRDTLLAAALPADADRPGVDQLDLSAFWPAFEDAAPGIFKLGLRATTWALTFAPIWVLGRPTTFGRLSPEDRDLLLQRVTHHRLYPVRQLATTLSLVACFAWFADPAARETV